MAGRETRSTARGYHAGRDSERGLALGLAVALILACAAVYSSVLGNGFVSFDDPRYIVGNAHVQLGLSWESVRWAFGHIYSDNWHPLTWLSHMLDVELFGLDPAGHHAMSVALHSVNAVLLFAVFRRFTAELWPSVLVAALFALHPLRVESVAWAAERKDVLSGLFFLLTILVYTRYTERNTYARYAFVIAVFACGLLAKPMLVTLPIVLLLLDFWPLRRMDGAPDPLPATQSPAQLVIEKLPLFGLALASGVITLYAQSRASTMKSFELISPIERLQNALITPVVYLQQFFWPKDLAFFYPHPALVEATSSLPLPLPFAWCAAACGLIMVALTAYCVRSWRSRPYIAAGWLWFCITLLPVIGLVQVGDQAHADRYTYLPAIGIAFAVVYGLHDLWRSRGWNDLAATASPNLIALAGCAAVLLGLGWASHQQVKVWRTSEQLYSHALEVTEQNYIAAFNLGAAFGKAGAYAEAIAFYDAVLVMRPEYAAAHSNMGVALEILGEEERALGHLREALRLDPRLAHAAINLGNNAMKNGNIEAARMHYETAIAARPDLALPYQVLSEFEEKQGNLDAAVRHLDVAVSIAPGAPHLHVKHGQLASRLGNDARALDDYTTALALDPDLLPAQNALALLLATSAAPSVRDGERAVELARACNDATQSMNPTFLRTLALALAESGDEAEAARVRKRALALTPGDEREAFRRSFDLSGSDGAPLPGDSR